MSFACFYRDGKLWFSTQCSSVLLWQLDSWCTQICWLSICNKVGLWSGFVFPAGLLCFLSSFAYLCSDARPSRAGRRDSLLGKDAVWDSIFFPNLSACSLVCKIWENQWPLIACHLLVKTVYPAGICLKASAKCIFSAFSHYVPKKLPYICSEWRRSVCLWDCNQSWARTLLEFQLLLETCLSSMPDNHGYRNCHCCRKLPILGIYEVKIRNAGLAWTES